MPNFTLLDKSNYLKGLLIIARKDNQLADSEKEILKKISDKLGFASTFFEETLQNLLINEHITEEPIKFSNKEIACSFISDGLKLAFSDKKIHEPEIEWLKSVCVENDIDLSWFNIQYKHYKDSLNISVENNLSLYSII